MSEFEEDVILPDDFTPEDTSIPEEVETEQQTEEVESTTTQTETVEQTETDFSPFLQALSEKIKFNHEPVTLNSIDEAIPLIQMGMNYNKVNEKLTALQNDPRITFMDEVSKMYGFDKAEDYIEAARQSIYEEQVKELVNKNIPEEYAREMVESRKFREKVTSEQEAQQRVKADEEAKNKQYADFLNYFKQANGREYAAEDKLPQEVIDQVENGQKSLKEAYMEHQNRELMNRIKVLEQNAQNAKKAPVSGVTIHGSNESSAEDDFLTGFNSI